MKYEITKEQIDNIIGIIGEIKLREGLPILQILQSLKVINNDESGSIKQENRESK